MEDFIPPFQVNKTAVYIQIVDSTGKSLTFMSLNEKDIKNAIILKDLLNREYNNDTI